MPQKYATYCEISVNALHFNPKSREVIERKQEILKSIADYHGALPDSILFYGFNPMILAKSFGQVFVTNVSQETKKFLDNSNIKYTYIELTDLVKFRKSFDWVVAGEEFFTFASTEDDQRDSVELLATLAKKVIITTLRDYKNQDFKDREFSQPLAVRNSKENKIFLEFHDHDFEEKNSWETSVYEIQGDTTKHYGPFDRRSMFFKQLAKFSLDAGANNFYVHKNLMYKSLIKKNYEHVISISF